MPDWPWRFAPEEPVAVVADIHTRVAGRRAKGTVSTRHRANAFWRHAVSADLAPAIFFARAAVFVAHEPGARPRARASDAHAVRLAPCAVRGKVRDALPV